MNMRTLAAKSEESVAFLVGLGCIVLYLMLQYSRGRFEWVTSMLTSSFVWVGSILLATFLLVLPIALGVIIVFRSIPALFERAFQRSLWSFTLGMLVLAIGVATVGVARTRSVFAFGYATRVRSEINVAVLQQWAMRAIKAAPKDHPTAIAGDALVTGSLAFSQVTVMPNADALQSYVRMQAAAPT